MGMTFQYISVKPGEGEHLLDSVLSPASAASRRVIQGWTIFILHEILEPATLEKLTAMGSERSGLAAAVFAQSSDYAYCVGAHDTKICFRAVLEERSAAVYQEGAWALEQCEALAGSSEWKSDAARRAQIWAARVPRSVNTTDVLDILDKDWLYPEVAALSLMHVLGVPVPPMEQL
jgi:hypothetical protein